MEDVWSGLLVLAVVALPAAGIGWDMSSRGRRGRLYAALVVVNPVVGLLYWLVRRRTFRLGGPAPQGFGVPTRLAATILAVLAVPAAVALFG